MVKYWQITYFPNNSACFTVEFWCRSQVAVGLKIGPDVPGKKAPLSPWFIQYHSYSLNAFFLWKYPELWGVITNLIHQNKIWHEKTDKVIWTFVQRFNKLKSGTRLLEGVFIKIRNGSVNHKVKQYLNVRNRRKEKIYYFTPF